MLALPQRARHPRAARDPLGLSEPAAALTRSLAQAAGVEDPDVRWRFCEGPYFDNQVATIKLDGRASQLVLDKVPPDPDGRDERLERVFEHRLA